MARKAGVQAGLQTGSEARRVQLLKTGAIQPLALARPPFSPVLRSLKMEDYLEAKLHHYVR